MIIPEQSQSHEFHITCKKSVSIAQSIRFVINRHLPIYYRFVRPKQNG